MKHKIGFNRLDRSSAHRKALHRSMVTSLLRHGRITTTKAKALEIRRSAEKMITRAKEDSVHNRRIVAKKLYDEKVLASLFADIAIRMKDRPGGYTRILKLGARPGDAAEMVLLELVDYKLPDKDDKGAKKSAKEDKKAKKNDEKKEETKKTVKPKTIKAKAENATAE